MFEIGNVTSRGREALRIISAPLLEFMHRNGMDHECREPALLAQVMISLHYLFTSFPRACFNYSPDIDNLRGLIFYWICMFENFLNGNLFQFRPEKFHYSKSKLTLLDMATGIIILFPNLKIQFLPIHLLTCPFVHYSYSSPAFYIPTLGMQWSYRLLPVWDSR